MISVNKLTVQFNGVDLFKEISFQINPKDRIGLVGKNGAGKSTLMKVLMKLVLPESGTLALPNDCTLGYLPQQMKLGEGKNVMDETMSAFVEVNTLTERLAQLNEDLASRDDYESDDYAKLINRITELGHEIEIKGGNQIAGRAEQALLGLGFERSDFIRPTEEFSGGWRMRIELAKILLQNPTVLLLDEPTNHLDIESIQWLENFLKSYSGAVVLISHDKAFLDAITTRTLEISLGRLYDYKSNYSKYLTLQKERRAQMKSAYENQQKMIAETEEFIERFRYKATKAVQVQSRIKMLEKVDRIEIDEEDTSSIHFSFPPAPAPGKIVFEAKGLGKAFDDLVVLEDLDFEIERGEKIAFVGRNGEGKSTLSKIIIGEHNFTGNLKNGHNITIGYYAQNQDELMDGNKTVFETLDDIAVGEVRKKVRDILGSFLFSGEDVEKKVKVLSGGERSRLAMAKLMLEPHNILVLDEPTNHLDIRSKEILKKALIEFDGTLLVVSHDRDFLDGLFDKIYEFRDKKIKTHYGGIYEFLKKKQLETLDEMSAKKAEQKQEGKKESSSKALFEERKLIDKQIRKISNQVKTSERVIEELEEELEAVNAKLASGDYEGNEIFEKHAETEQKLTGEMEKWENLQFELDELQDKRAELNV